jgi:tetratricopeptide (TPR) repeat protein
VVALVGAGGSIPLGYPPWKTFATETLADGKIKAGLTSDEIKTLEDYAGFLNMDLGKELSAQVMLGECERLCGYDDEQKKLSRKFRDVVGGYFEGRHKRFSEPMKLDGRWVSADDKFDEKNNPYLALLQLPIRRFITTNYDLEIERALLMKGKLPYSSSREEIKKVAIDELIKLAGNRSFSQHHANYDSLAKFPIARYEDNDYMVFHCHGRIDEIYNCIITEEDYQRWYLKDAPEYLPFRQTLDLTLGSNPILIIGYGLGDIDLMRWLRTITANRPEDKVRNPLFCINYITETEYENRWNKNRLLIEAEADAMYLRYGLHVITVYQKDPETGTKETLCGALLKLRERWQGWWDDLLLKPKFRKTPTGNFQPDSYYHYRIDIDRKVVDSLHKRLEKELDKRLGLERGRETQDGRLAVVVGDGGTGKSWSVQKYLESKEQQFKETTPEKNWTFIFWSSYYANDVLTGIDRLIDYFRYLENQTNASPAPEAEDSATEDRFANLAKFLSTGRPTIIVFDGVEKLLKPNKEENVGESISPEITNFFKLISPANTSCKIILTTRLFPLDVFPNPVSTSLQADALTAAHEKLTEKREEEPVSSERERWGERRDDYEIIVPRCWSEDLIDDNDVTEFSFLSSIADERDKKTALSPLCSLVDGHIFCIALVRGILDDDKQDRDKCWNKYRDLLRDIANTPIDRRIYRVISEAIEHLDESKYSNRTVQKFIERVSLFMHPVRREVALTCLHEVEDEINTRRSDEMPSSGQMPASQLAPAGSGFNWSNFSVVHHQSIDELLDELLKDLVEKNLLQLVILDSTPDRIIKGYVVHPLVRNYVHQTIHKSLFTSLPSLQLPGLTSAMEVVDPGSRDRGVVVTKSLIHRLCEEAKKSKWAWKEKWADRVIPEAELSKKKIYLDMCRGAFSILRSRFCSNTVTRWGDYREYLNLVVELYDTTREVSDGTWTHNEPTPVGRDDSRGEFAPLYADELAWVYNEVGFASFSMGNLLNAIPFREQGLQISRLIDKDKSGRYLFQSEFNLGTSYIFLGRLTYAMSYLQKAMEIGTTLNDPTLISRVKAYIALVKYLQGNLEEANLEFNSAYEMLADNPRARGVFYCYHGELLLKLDELPQAKAKIDQSRHIGEAEYYLDVVAYARLANANYLLKRKEYTEAQNEYTFALKVAQKTKLRRLETGVLSGMSRLAYELNDSEAAKQRAIEALKIANEYVLCLHQTVALLVLGRALIKKGNQRELGISCLRTARNMAKAQGYFLRKNEAEYELQQLGEI